MAEATGPAIRNKRIYSLLFLVRCLLMSRLVPAYVPLKEICINALQLLYPHLLAGTLDSLLQSKHLFPSNSNKHLLRLVLDVSLILWKRSIECREGSDTHDLAPPTGHSHAFQATHYVRFTGADFLQPKSGQCFRLCNTQSLIASCAMCKMTVCSRMFLVQTMPRC